MSPGAVSKEKVIEDDSALVAAAVAGDREAFAEIVRRHQGFVYGACMRVVKNPALAEDVAQETFLRAWRGLGDFRGDSQVRSWLYRIAYNLSLNAVTRAREVPTDTIPERVAATGPAQAAVNAEMGEAFRTAVAQLPEDLREPLVLREVDHLSYEEISQRLDLPLNTVRTRIFRARKTIQKQMGEWR